MRGKACRASIADEVPTGTHALCFERRMVVVTVTLGDLEPIIAPAKPAAPKRATDQ